MNNLATAITSKATGSNFLNAIGGRLRNGEAEVGEPYPYSVFLLPVSDDPQSESTWGGDYEDILMQFSIFSILHAPSEAWTIHGYLKALYDDCTLTITDQTLIKMERVNTILIPEDHAVKAGTQRVWHIATDYSITTKV